KIRSQLSVPSLFIAGSAAGAIQCVICCPMELAKTRMQLQGTGEYKLKTKNYKNSLDCLIKIYRKEGLRGINRGMELFAPESE
uniref:Uncharacterized protein n=1 Tax=Apteryx owenii TaxID=8824 RepID=A0A8B9PZU1_APTOW